MDSLLNRYRNLSVLLLVIVAQLLLLAYQVRSSQDVRLIRVWSVTAVMPLARLVETVRTRTVSFLREYVALLDVRQDNGRMQRELGRLKMENQYLKTELGTADRARALSVFQSRSPSRTIAARIIGSGTGASSRVVFVDRGSSNGVAKGMAVVTPDGIVGKVIASYPTASQVVLVTDPSFAAGVVSQVHRVHGTLKGQGHSSCLVDYVQTEEKVAVGEWFYTSGDDRVFPKGLPVGQVRISRTGRIFKEIFLTPSGLQQGLEEVLIVLEGVHQPVPDGPQAPQPLHLLSPPPPDSAAAADQFTGVRGGLSTDADRLLERYRRIGEAQKHVFGEGAPGSRPPNFNLNPDAAGGAAAPAPAAPKTPASPAAPKP